MLRQFKNFLFFLSAVVIVSLPAKAEALISLSGNGPLGSYIGTFDYSASNATTAQLVINLENTSPAANGGYITAFVFNNPGDNITGASLTSTDSDFGIIGDPLFQDSITGAPFGQFDVGTSTGGSFTGGGNPTVGIAVGVDETFTFNFTGNNLNTLSEANFFSELSSGTAGEGFQSFVVRFRGFEDGGSDKVLGTGQVVPEPTSLLLLGSGLLTPFLRRKLI